MTIHGIPLHPLIVHAAVVLVPLACAGAVAYAVLTKHRWLTRTPTLLAAAAAAVSVQLAAMTGDELKDRLNEHTKIIATHEMWAGRLQAAAWVMLVIVAAAWWSLPHHNPLPEKGHHEGVTVLSKPLVVLLVIAAVAVLVLVVLTGDAGARAVWGPGS